MENTFVPHSIAHTLSPLLAPSEIVGIDVEFEKLVYPYFASVKFNGVRGIFLNNEIISRSGNRLNICNSIMYQLQPLIDWCYENKIVLDGEFHAYSDNTVGGTLSILAGNKKMPYDFKFKIFGVYTNKQWNGGETLFIEDMFKSPIWTELALSPPINLIELVLQEHVDSAESLRQLSEKVQTNPLVEGLMLIAPSLIFVHRKLSVKELKFLKLKFYSDPIDAQIIGISARMEHLPGTIPAEETPLGKASRSRKQDDMVYTEIGGCLMVKTEAGQVVSIPFPKGTSLQQRTLYFKHFRKGGSFDLYGRWVQFRKLSAGEKDKPNAVRCVEFRDSKGNII